jgi:hypothetical protein
MRKPKMKRLPKKPKKSASLETVKKYLARVKEITRENKKKISDYHKTQKLISKIHSN